MPNLRALITELANELDYNRQCLLDDRRLTHPLADKARAALDEPEPEGPTKEELWELWLRLDNELPDRQLRWRSSGNWRILNDQPLCFL